jgi:membrane protease YdiL (CAAX protease family)
MMGGPPDFPNDIENGVGRTETNDGLVFNSDLSLSAEPAPTVPILSESAEVTLASPEIPPAEKPLFAHYEYLPPPRPAPRKPNFGDFLIFLLVTYGGFLASLLVIFAALHFHLFGVSTAHQAADEIHYKIGSQAAWYVLTLFFCITVFPLIWHKRFFDGLQWRATAALRHVWRLLGAAAACFVAALADEILIPGPANTPIDQTFRIPGAIWLLFGFGVTLAPLMEEIAYRGFLLPALCTAYDWMVEQATGSKPPQPRTDGSGRWSIPAMVVASVISSVPFALMHGEQTAWSIGPFLLLVSISLVLCWIRLAARSLAASVMVHSSYNLLLFSLMFLGTGGFRHLDKM